MSGLMVFFAVCLSLAWNTEGNSLQNYYNGTDRAAITILGRLCVQSAEDSFKYMTTHYQPAPELSVNISYEVVVDQPAPVGQHWALVDTEYLRYYNYFLIVSFPTMDKALRVHSSVSPTEAPGTSLVTLDPIQTVYGGGSLVIEDNLREFVFSRERHSIPGAETYYILRNYNGDVLEHNKEVAAGSASQGFAVSADKVVAGNCVSETPAPPMDTQLWKFFC